jgi:hypothetical protein
MKKKYGMSGLVLLAVFGLLTVLMTITKYADYDLWWHIKLGEQFMSTGSLPWLDTFSYTAQGARQFVGEWLADVIIYLAFAGGGFWGINLLKLVLLAGMFFCLFRSLSEEQGLKLAVAVLTLTVALFAIRFRLFVRPYLFSMLFAALFLYLTERWKRGKQGGLIYLLPALMLLWANLSVGAVFGVLILGFGLFSELVERRSLRLLPVLLLVVAASLCNPETYKLYTLALNLTSDPYREMIGEYQSMTRDILFGSGLRYTLPFQIIAVGSCCYLLFCRGWKNTFHLCLFLFFIFETFRQVRIIEMSTFVLAPMFGMALQRLLDPLYRRFAARTENFNAAAALIIACLIPGAIFYSAVYAFGVGPKPGAFPEKALQFAEANHITGRMFNSYAYGGYLTWGAPERPVFIDGRYRRVYSPEFYGEYKKVMETAEDWRKAEEKYGFDYAVLEYDLMSGRFPVHLSENPDWAIVYWDNSSVIAVKRTPARAELIARCEYRVAKPKLGDFSYMEQVLQFASIDDVLAGLDHDIALNPENQYAIFARAFTLFKKGRSNLPRIAGDLKRITGMKPDFSMKHSAYAIVLWELGEKEKTRDEITAALKMDRLNPAALSLAKRIGMPITLPKGAIPGHP